MARTLRLALLIGLGVLRPTVSGGTAMLGPFPPTGVVLSVPGLVFSTCAIMVFSL